MSASPRDATAFEVRDALREPGCAVCRLTMRSVGRVLQSIAYEQVNDLSLRKELRIAGGFCNPHAHQWLRESRSALGTALIYRDVAIAALRAFDDGQKTGLLRGLLGAADRRSSGGACPACRLQLEAEARYIDALVAVVTADSEALKESHGVCRRHTWAAVRVGGPGADVILQQTRRAMDALVHDLDEVIRKEDYRFRHEQRTDSERSAPARAVAWSAGVEGLVDE